MTNIHEHDFPYTQLFAHEFVTCAGSVLFRRDCGQECSLHVCILHDRKTGENILPKGRQDCGKSLRETAVRETYEETGHDCELLPVTLVTRATPPNADVGDEPRETKNCTEPFALTIRKAMTGSIKFIYWYIAICKLLPSDSDNSLVDQGEKKRTQTASEDYETEWCRLVASVDLGEGQRDEVPGAKRVPGICDIANAVASKLSSPKDRELLKRAIEIVGQTYPQWFNGS
jgi:8-oxo-dGTP pyrophosphatase MutT (NUDIX family)